MDSDGLVDRFSKAGFWVLIVEMENLVFEVLQGKRIRHVNVCYGFVRGK